MSVVAILGTGGIGRAIAGKLVAAGNAVIMGSRDPLAAAAKWPDAPQVEFASWAEAADQTQVVVNALPGHASLDVLRGLAAPLVSKVLIDVANAVTFDANGFAETLIYPGSSLAEQIQQALPATRVVKTLNTLGPADLLVDPASLKIPPTAFLSGEDGDAKQVAEQILADLGWPAEWVIDLGGVDTARAPEAFILLIRPLFSALGPIPFGMSIAR